MHDVPHLSTGGDRTLAPLHHTVITDAESLGEFLPRQAGELPEPLQPLPEILREELGVGVLCPRSLASIVLPPPSASSVDYVQRCPRPLPAHGNPCTSHIPANAGHTEERGLGWTSSLPTLYVAPSADRIDSKKVLPSGSRCLIRLLPRILEVSNGWWHEHDCQGRVDQDYS